MRSCFPIPQLNTSRICAKLRLSPPHKSGSLAGGRFASSGLQGYGYSNFDCGLLTHSFDDPLACNDSTFAAHEDTQTAERTAMLGGFGGGHLSDLIFLNRKSCYGGSHSSGGFFAYLHSQRGHSSSSIGGLVGGRLCVSIFLSLNVFFQMDAKCCRWSSTVDGTLAAPLFSVGGEGCLRFSIVLGC